MTPLILPVPRTSKAFLGFVVPIPILESVLIPVATSTQLPPAKLKTLPLPK